MVNNFKQLVGEKFHSSEMDIEDFKKLIRDFMADTSPGDEVIDIEINDEGFINIKFKSGKEEEIEVDWNELILK